MAEHHNPNQQGGSSSDSRSTLTIFLVMILAFLGWQYFMQKPTPATKSPAATTAPAAPATTAAPAATPESAPPATGKSAAKSTVRSEAKPTAPVVAAATESQTVVENELYRITFTNRGAHVTSWILKKYKDSQGKPLDLVDTDLSKKFGYPLSLFTYDPALTTSINQALYQASATGQLTSTTADGATLDFKYADGSGVEVHKTFHFDSTYVLHADVVVTKNGEPVRALLNWPSGLGDQEDIVADSKTRRRGTGASAGMVIDESRAGKTTHVSSSKVSGGATADGQLDWSGVSNLYFTATFLPDAPNSASLLTEYNTEYVALDPSKPTTTTPMPVLGVALGDTSGHTQLRVYAGPKDIYVLDKIHASGNPKVTLKPVVNFGWSILNPISEFLFILLHWTYEHVLPSWGWAIVIVTLFVTLVFLPLRISSMRSALKMQRIQPQVTAIRERYKKYKVTDPQYANMNQEITGLYKKEKVNMFGGCLPLVVQMPLLFAFYDMLGSAIELRQAHWLWLPDLSMADPIHVLPILMIVSQFLVQFYTPSPGMDPAQQKMMAFTMPAFSGYICWKYASGLALYWAVSNIIGIVQQLIMNRTSLGREMREVALKRAKRKQGKIIQARK